MANLGERVADFERQLVAQTTEAEMLGRRVQDLEKRLDEQSRCLADRELECNQLRNRARRGAQDRSRSARRARRDRPPPRAATEGVACGEGRCRGPARGAQEERAQLQHEIAGMKREAESTWASERVENALLRERINDVAAEVARLTCALEGPGSPIEAILAGGDAARRPSAEPPRWSTATATATPPSAGATSRPGHAGRPHPRPAEPRLAGAARELSAGPFSRRWSAGRRAAAIGATRSA